jgi:Fe2+ transport system protein FeoA
MSEQSTSQVTLAQIASGEKVTLRQFSPHKGSGFTSRLASLGFTPGVVIEMMQNYWHGPLVVSVRGTRVALGRQEAQNIFVERCT